MSELNKELHVKFIENLDNKKEDFEYWLAEHLKVSGVYWAVTSLQILNSKDNLIKEDDVIKFILDCQDKDSGGFGGNIGHDPHILYTLSALQVLAIYNKLDLIDKSSVVNYIKSLQDPTTGSFSGDEWGEIDVRFTYCALSSLSLLGSLDGIDLKLAIQFICKCQNFDGGYGSFPGAESHAGLVFCCVGSLAIVDALEYVDIDRLCWWLSERQLKCGGLNGRPEKLEDVCYSWWVLSCLNMLNRSDWIDKPKLIEFILSAQDTEGGGIADRPGNVSDVFHTLFGLAALSMLGYDGLQEIDPRFCLPRHVTLHLGL